jgi:hypothetical protein
MLPVLRTATADESALVTVDQLRDSEPASSAPQRVPSPPTTSPSPSKRTAKPSVTPTPRRTGTTSPSATTTRSPSPASTTETTTTEDGWTVSTNGDGDRSYVRSFRVEGGQTVIQMTPDKVRLVTATPADGYAVATVQDKPDNLAVYFNEPNHSFVIHAVWFNDAPFAEVSEIGS